MKKVANEEEEEMVPTIAVNSLGNDHDGEGQSEVDPRHRSQMTMILSQIPWVINVSRVIDEIWQHVQLCRLQIGEVLAKDNEIIGPKLVFVLSGKLAYFQRKSNNGLREESNALALLIKSANELAMERVFPLSEERVMRAKAKSAAARASLRFLATPEEEKFLLINSPEFFSSEDQQICLYRREHNELLFNHNEDFFDNHHHFIGDIFDKQATSKSLVVAAEDCDLAFLSEAGVEKVFGEEFHQQTFVAKALEKIISNGSNKSVITKVAKLFRRRIVTGKIFSCGCASDEVFIVKQGSVLLTSEKNVKLCELTEGKIFGFEDAVLGTKRSYSASTLTFSETITVCVISIEQFLKYISAEVLRNLVSLSHKKLKHYYSKSFLRDKDSSMSSTPRTPRSPNTVQQQFTTFSSAFININNNQNSIQHLQSSTQPTATVIGASIFANTSQQLSASSTMKKEALNCRSSHNIQQSSFRPQQQTNTKKRKTSLSDSDSESASSTQQRDTFAASLNSDNRQCSGEGTSSNKSPSSGAIDSRLSSFSQHISSQQRDQFHPKHRKLTESQGRKTQAILQEKIIQLPDDYNAAGSASTSTTTMVISQSKYGFSSRSSSSRISEGQKGSSPASSQPTPPMKFQLSKRSLQTPMSQSFVKNNESTEYQQTQQQPQLQSHGMIFYIQSHRASLQVKRRSRIFSTGERSPRKMLLSSEARDECVEGGRSVKKHSHQNEETCDYQRQQSSPICEGSNSSGVIEDFRDSSRSSISQTRNRSTLTSFVKRKEPVKEDTKRRSVETPVSILQQYFPTISPRTSFLEKSQPSPSNHKSLAEGGGSSNTEWTTTKTATAIPNHHHADDDESSGLSLPSRYYRNSFAQSPARSSDEILKPVIVRKKISSFRQNQLNTKVNNILDNIQDGSPITHSARDSKHSAYFQGVNCGKNYSSRSPFPEVISQQEKQQVSSSFSQQLATIDSREAENMAAGGTSDDLLFGNSVLSHYFKQSTDQSSPTYRLSHSPPQLLHSSSRTLTQPDNNDFPEFNRRHTQIKVKKFPLAQQQMQLHLSQDQRK